MSGDVTLGGASTDTVSDVCTVKSFTVSRNTTLLANVVWARRAPTLSRCGLKLHLATHPLLLYGRGSVTVTAPTQFVKLSLSSTVAYDGLLRWQVRSHYVAT